MTHVVLHSDGGARGNPGPAGIGVVVEVERDGRRDLVEEIAETIGVATNNVAEYRALIRGLEAARGLSADEVSCFLDSQLVVEQMNGRYKVKHENVVGLHRQATDLARAFRRVTYSYVPRAQNAGADRLVNAALDGDLDGELPGGGVVAPRPAEPAPLVPDARRAAMDLVREAYYNAAHMATGDLKALNRRRPPGMRYESHRQLVHEFLLMAGAISTFAVQVGLVQPDELKAFLREFWAEQPDLIDQEDEAWIQQNFDLSPQPAGEGAGYTTKAGRPGR
ncbi:MAG: ribonuclease / adenosylcobalamin/alpha-ribazole phosphatase [Chloroflexota bacterium]|nr:ribonuclease / adenosylcobalamin/alpha-ribazole phosphatase [Chloroflexota bacterium]